MHGNVAHDALDGPPTNGWGASRMPDPGVEQLRRNRPGTMIRRARSRETSIATMRLERHRGKMVSRTASHKAKPWGTPAVSRSYQTAAAIVSVPA